MVSIKFIITIPHSCHYENEFFSFGKHTCDRIANKAGKNLYKYLEKSIILYGDKNRTILDLNRKESRKSSFRLFLNKLISYSSPEWILDIHSFPGDSPDMKGEIVILYLLEEKKPKILINYLRNYGIRTNARQGSYMNDIILEAQYHNKKYLLLEYNEDLSTVRLDYISRIITKYLLDD